MSIELHPRELGLLVMLLLSSVYLVLRLGHIQDRMEESGALDISAGHLGNWHNFINSRWEGKSLTSFMKIH